MDPPLWTKIKLLSREWLNTAINDLVTIASEDNPCLEDWYIIQSLVIDKTIDLFSP